MKYNMKLTLNGELLNEGEIELATTTFEDRLNTFQRDSHNERSKTIVISRANFYSSVMLEAKFPAQLSGPLYIRYKNEKGIDCGGLSRDFFEQIGLTIESQKSLRILKEDLNQAMRLTSYQNPEALTAFGAVVANSFISKFFIGVNFNPLIKHLILKKSLSLALVGVLVKILKIQDVEKIKENPNEDDKELTDKDIDSAEYKRKLSALEAHPTFQEFVARAKHFVDGFRTAMGRSLDSFLILFSIDELSYFLIE